MYFDSAPALWTSDQVSCAMKTLGSAQVLFGSDYPVLPHWMKAARAAMDGVEMEEAERQAVMGGNAASLLGIDT
jgi:predicted TIM-barrel fold metal-dependent hydrolase